MITEKKTLADYQKILDSISKNANSLYQQAMQELRVINDNKVISEGYELYQNILNQTPLITTSNHVG